MSEFQRFLRDTIILLGGGTKLADLVKYATGTDREIAELRQININLCDAVKTRLANLSVISVKVKGDNVSE